MTLDNYGIVYHSSIRVSQVPPEVSKVGVQDPSFVQPLSQRKGGIAAMFANQAAKSSPSKPTSSQNSPSKASSPKLSRSRDEEPAEVLPPAKKKKTAHSTKATTPMVSDLLPGSHFHSNDHLQSPLKGKVSTEKGKITQFFAKAE